MSGTPDKDPTVAKPEASSTPPLAQAIRIGLSVLALLLVIVLLERIDNASYDQPLQPTAAASLPAPTSVQTPQEAWAAYSVQYYAYQRRALEHRQQAFEWSGRSARLMFWLSA